MFFSKRTFNALSSSSRCSGDNFFLLLLVFFILLYYSLTILKCSSAANSRRQAKVYYGCFPRFGGEGNIALVFPLPVSKATGDGYPLPFKAAISITTSF